MAIFKLTRKEEKAFTRYLFQQDFIEEGSGRKVYKWRSWVIKVAKNRNGRLQNKLEVKRFLEYGKENLAIVYAFSKNILIMERVDTALETINKYATAEQGMALCSWLDKICGIDFQDHDESQGITKDGRLVAYDYGDSKKTYCRKLRWDLNFHEFLATKISDESKK